MAALELPALRPWADFYPGAERFSRPDLRDPTKWNHRVINNLLYYQTNYMAMAVGVFLLVGFLNPAGMFLGMAVVAAVFIGSVWAGENKSIIKNFKQQNPAVFVVGVMVVSYMLMYMHADGHVPARPAPLERHHGPADGLVPVITTTM
ncbi:hypothetical protein NHX12_029993 [Muraenolepis orangiensis]|uniref:PRA1 family protein n=1 Tax=Muraenolepis orangiensis TaxID=630683 RepID=A0A9Q0E8Z8_9TELE|nr:hypothetical protein NHX12_029993 [Muraenolepis orangiensis]